MSMFARKFNIENSIQSQLYKNISIEIQDEINKSIETIIKLKQVKNLTGGNGGSVHM